MRREVLRFSGWVALVLVLSLALVSGCTRSKSEGPPEPDEGAQTVQPQSASEEPTTTLSGDEEMNARTTALAAEGTAAAAAQQTQEAGVPPTDTPKPEEPTHTPTPESADTSEPEGTPEPTEAPTATKPPSSGATTHTVKAGENLFRIALNYGLTYQQLAAHNGIANPNFILVGQVLKIPPSGGTAPPPSSGGTGVHTVQKGENLFRVALKYNMVYTVLAEANDLSYPYTIYPGQQLIIP